MRNSWECSKPRTINKRVLWGHHQMLLLLVLLCIGRLIWIEGIRLILTHICHLNRWVGGHVVWVSEWIIYLKRVWCRSSIHWLLWGSICTVFIQTIQNERVHTTSLHIHFSKIVSVLWPMQQCELQTNCWCRLECTNMEIIQQNDLLWRIFKLRMSSMATILLYLDLLHSSRNFQ